MNRIRQLREERNLRQIDVSRETGIDQKTLSNYETEKTNPDSYALIRLADFFKVSIDYILCHDVNHENQKEIILKLKKVQEEINNIINIMKK